MKRVGRKGEGRFERISWDEALDTIAAKFTAIAASAGRTAGHRPVFVRRHDGTPAVRLDGPPLLPSAGRVAARPDDLRDRRQGRLGRHRSARRSAPIVEQFEHSRLILIWGSNPIVSNLHFWSRAQEAKRRGAKLIAIDPYRSATAEKCHEHLALLPGTDAALALGMMHVLIAEDLLDHDYVARYTLGFDALKARAAEYPPERVAAICGLTRRRRSSPSRRDYGTTKPAAIRVELRPAAARGRRQRGACDRMPAGADRIVARPRRRRAAVVVGHVSGRQRQRSSGPT